MILTELSSVGDDALPVQQFAEHLRLGTEFAETALQNDLLSIYLRAAIAAIEGKTGRVILQKNFSWQVTGWRYVDHQVLPARPVVSVTALRTFDRAGAVTDHGPDTYDFVADDSVPSIQSVGSSLPSIADGGSAEIEFVAGHGAIWAEVPNDLQQAVIILASQFYENRTGAPDPSGVLPMAVLALIEPYRPIRLFGGAR